MEKLVIFGSIYQGKRVLVTGHTGFKGAWTSLFLNLLGAHVFGYALAPKTHLDMYGLLPPELFAHEWLADIRDEEVLRRALEESKPDLIIHMAAQPLVRESYEKPLETFSVNAFGTLLLLETVRSLSLPSAVMIVTSDKCYHNDDQGRPFEERDPLGGKDPYSLSKAVAELITASWRSSYFQHDPCLGPLVSVRAGNVIGGGDYSEDRIVPDCVRSQIKGTPLLIRHPSSTRPWQHVLDCISGYLALGQAILTRPPPLEDKMSAFNFGPSTDAERTVDELVDAFFKDWPGRWVSAPDASTKREAVRLSLNSDKAKSLLGWHPTWDFQTSVRHTSKWYSERHLYNKQKHEMFELSQRQVIDHSKDAASSGMAWAYPNQS